MWSLPTVRTARGIVEWRLCLGCGACSYICPDAKINLVDVLGEGIRPVVSDERCGDCRLCLEVCPAYESDQGELRKRPGVDQAVLDDFGPVLAIWEGYASDPEIRHRGASGGAITAIALHALERRDANGVLQLQPDPADPLRNRTRLSRNRADLLLGTGSRYAPGSVCDGLGLVEAAPGPCVVIGQPSEITALRKAEHLKPALAQRVGLAISFFCAGSPATAGTVELLRSAGVNQSDVRELRYRGLGWPGHFAVRTGDDQFRPVMSYERSWGFLQRFRPYGIYLFPDNSGEHADISCGDAWHRPEDGADGFSIVVARTERGRRAVRAALDDGYFVGEQVGSARLRQAQQSLLGRKGAVWGRVLAFRLCGLPAPRLRGFGGASAWLRLPLSQQLKSTAGTLRRIVRRGYFRRLSLDLGGASGGQASAVVGPSAAEQHDS